MLRFTKLLAWIKNQRSKTLVLGISVLFPILSFLLLLSDKREFPIAIPLWFSKPWGLERLAAPSFLWLLPWINIFILITNLFLSYYLYKTQRTLSLILLWANPLLGFLLFFTLLKIVLLSS